MTEGCPGNPCALTVELHLRAIAFRIKICHDRVHILSGDALSALEALVDVQLELSQQRHNKEITVEVGKGFLQEADLELQIGIRLQQMCPHQRLVEIRRHLGYEQ